MDLNVEDPAFDQSTFAKNRERLLKHDVSRKFFEAVLKAFGGGRKLRYLGLKRNQQWAELATAAFNLVRISNLMAEAA
jgi:hypothetical protein